MSVLPPSVDSLLTRFLGKPARLCPSCGGRRYRLNPAGAILCVVCKPADPSYPELVAELAGKPPRLAWSVPSEDFDCPDAAAGQNTAGGNGEPSGGVGPGAGAAGAGPDGWGDPESRLDPDNGPSALLIVSTRLEFAHAPLGGFWESPDAEIVCLPSPGVPDAPVGIWRRMTQPYFAWMVANLKRMNESGDRDHRNTEVKLALQEIAVEAYQCGVFGDWALDLKRWPWAPPPDFRPPAMPRNSRVWDWDRGVSGSQLDRLVSFEPDGSGGKELRNGGSGRAGNGNSRSRSVAPVSVGGIRRDGLFADECPD